MTGKEWIGKDRELMNTGLFEYDPARARILKNTDYSASIFFDFKVLWWKKKYDYNLDENPAMQVSFDEVLNTVPEEIRRELIYNLDLFR